MAKFKLEVEIGYIGEDYNLDEAVINEIESNIVNKIKFETIERIKEEALCIAENSITEWVEDTIKTMVTSRKIPKNSYSKEMITLEEMIGEKFERALSETVDKEGRATNYGGYGTRLQWLCGESAKKYADERVRGFVKDIKYDIEQYTSKKVKEELLSQLTNQLVKNIDFNQVFGGKEHE